MRRLTVIAAAIVLAGSLGACAGAAAGGAASAGVPTVPAYTEVLGTWAGPVYAEGDDQGADLTLVLTEVEGGLGGTMSVPDVMMDRIPIKEARYEAGLLLFYLDFAAPDGSMLRIDWQFRRNDDVLTGTFDSDYIGGYATLRRMR